MPDINAELYIHPKTGRFLARIRGAPYVATTGHDISEDSGRFTVRSIITKNSLLCHEATRGQAERDIAGEWTVLVSRHKPQTSRERDNDWDASNPDQRRAELQLRNSLARNELRSMLRPGDRIRATKAECGSREASFTFSHWDGEWIQSNGGASIAPGSVYSINGKVYRV